jgi:hypothetical protein
MKAEVPALIAEHYAALADYGTVNVRPVRIVRTWHEARRAGRGACSP